MGQRHQIYVRVKEGDKKVVYGFHHQWLYGKTALKSLLRVLTFSEGEGNYNALRDFSYQPTSDVIKSILSTDWTCGYYHMVHPFQSDRFNTMDSQEEEWGQSCIKDPREGDNNDGITIIDFTGKTPAYCFMSLLGLECDTSQLDKIEDLTPLSAEKYLTAYYPNFKSELYPDFETIDQEREHREECIDLVGALDGYKILTLKQIQSIFPKMYADKIRKVG